MKMVILIVLKPLNLIIKIVSFSWGWEGFIVSRKGFIMLEILLALLILLQMITLLFYLSELMS